jgi:hypothetical protein
MNDESLLLKVAGQGGAVVDTTSCQLLDLLYRLEGIYCNYFVKGQAATGAKDLLQLHNPNGPNGVAINGLFVFANYRPALKWIVSIL